MLGFWFLYESMKSYSVSRSTISNSESTIAFPPETVTEVPE